MSGFDAAGLPVRAFTLDVHDDEHRRRILSDQAELGALEWRLEKARAYREAFPWLAKRTTVIDTTAVTPDQVASSILTTLNETPPDSIIK